MQPRTTPVPKLHHEDLAFELAKRDHTLRRMPQTEPSLTMANQDALSILCDANKTS